MKNQNRIWLFLCVFFSFIPLISWSMDESLISMVSPYKKVLRKYTRDSSLYSIQNIDTKLKWTATYQSEKFRQAFEELYHKIYPEGAPPYVEEMAKPIAGESQTGFFVAIHARPNELQNLKDPKNYWKIHLRVGSETYEPILVEEVSENAFYSKFYPYFDRWYRGYKLVFPLDVNQSKASRMILEIDSVGGKSRLKFSI